MSHMPSDDQEGKLCHTLVTNNLKEIIICIQKYMFIIVKLTTYRSYNVKIKRR
jgi:hypothetical protein